MAQQDLSGAQAAPAVIDGLEGKARVTWAHMFALAVMAGVFIAFGSIAYLIVQSVPDTAYGPTHFLSGVAFSVGLVLVMVAGAQLFTGNTMQLVTSAEGSLGPLHIAAAWTCVWIGNLVGSLIIAALFLAAGGLSDMDGQLATAAASVAGSKLEKDVVALLAAGTLANMLVCLAVWMSAAAVSVPGKILAIIGPVAVFVAAGFEHSVANMSLLPIGIAGGAPLDWVAVAKNLSVVTVGNIIGGASMAFGLTYGHAALDVD